MQANIPIKSAEQKKRLRARKQVRRHGDHTSKCVVYRINKDGRIQVRAKAFEGTSKYQKVGTRTIQEVVEAA